MGRKVRQHIAIVSTMSSIDLRLLRYFVTVAEELNFCRAARRLHMAQPPLSQQIQSLEHRLGAKLFDRETRPISLTPAGAALVDQARDVLVRADRLSDTLLAFRKGEVGQLTVGCVPSAFLDVAPAAFSAYRTRYPGVTLTARELDTDPLIAALNSREVNVALLRMVPTSNLIDSRILRTEPLIAALPASHRLGDAERVDLADLAEDNFVMWPRRMGREYYDLVLASCVRQGFSPRILAVNGAHSTQIGYVACGIGIAIVPESVRMIRHPAVVYKDLAPEAPQLESVIAWSSTQDFELQRLFIGTALELFPGDTL